jgi:hypothetical protein
MESSIKEAARDYQAALPTYGDREFLQSYGPLACRGLGQPREGAVLPEAVPPGPVPHDPVSHDRVAPNSVSLRVAVLPR